MELISTHLVKTQDLGAHGNLFGGQLLKWIDADAAAYAMQTCDTSRVITISIDKCVFKKPAKEGQLLKVYGEVEKVGNTSVTLNIEARAHNVYNGKQYIIVSTSITFVKVDGQGEPIPISEKVKNKYSKQ